MSAGAGGDESGKERQDEKQKGDKAPFSNPAAVSLDDGIRWFSIDPRTKETVEYSLEHSAKLEQAFQTDRRKNIPLKIGSFSFTIDFKSMYQTSNRGGRRKICREAAPKELQEEAPAVDATQQQKVHDDMAGGRYSDVDGSWQPTCYKMARYALEKGCFADPSNPSRIVHIGEDYGLNNKKIEKLPGHLLKPVVRDHKDPSHDEFYDYGETNDWSDDEEEFEEEDGGEPVTTTTTGGGKEEEEKKEQEKEAKLPRKGNWFCAETKRKGTLPKLKSKAREKEGLYSLVDFDESYGLEGPNDQGMRFFVHPHQKPKADQKSTRVDIPVITKTSDSYHNETRAEASEIAQISQLRHSNKGIKDNAFLIQNLLTKVECDHLRIDTSPLMKSTDDTFAQSYRHSDRVLLNAPKLSQELFRRIVPHFKPSDYKDRIPLCFGQGGVWIPFGLNECIKINRYGAGGHFRWHRDGPWIPREDQASIYTVVVYLNDDFLGGLTCLCQSHVTEEQLNREKAIKAGLYKPTEEDEDDYNTDFRAHRSAPFGQRNYDHTTMVIPCTGSAFIFNHDMWHGSTMVKGPNEKFEPQSGQKWILRTELIMQKVHSFYVDRFAYASDAKYKECTKMYEESQKALMDGKREQFVDQYQKVVEMQRIAMWDAVDSEERTECLIKGANADVLSEILSYNSDAELAVLMRSSKKGFYQVLQSDVWQMKFCAKYPAAVRNLGLPKSAGGEAMGGGDPLKIVQNSKLQHLGSLPCDWYTLYRQRKLLYPRPEFSQEDKEIREEVLASENLSQRVGQFGPVGLILRQHGPTIVKPVGVRQEMWEEDAHRGGPLGEYFFDLEGQPHIPIPAERKATTTATATGSPARSIGLLRGESIAEQKLESDARSQRVPQGVEVSDERKALDWCRGEEWMTTYFDRFFSAWYGGFPWHMNQPIGEELVTVTDAFKASDDSRLLRPIVNCSSGEVEVSILSPLAKLAYDPTWHPTLVIGLNNWYRQNGDGEKRRGQNNKFIMDYFQLLRTPAIQILHPVVPVVAALNKIEKVDLTGTIYSPEDTYPIAVACVTEETTETKEDEKLFQKISFLQKESPELVLNVTIVDRRSGKILVPTRSARLAVITKGSSNEEARLKNEKKQLPLFCQEHSSDLLPTVLYYEYLGVDALEKDEAMREVEEQYYSEDWSDDEEDEEEEEDKDESRAEKQKELKTRVVAKGFPLQKAHLVGDQVFNTVLCPKVQDKVFQQITYQEYDKAVAALCTDINFREEALWRPLGAFAEL